MENVTISDIAKEAGVSIGTVSNVINKKGNVKIETIRKVEEAAKKLGYVRNENAQVMKKGKSATVLLLVPVLNDAVSPLIVDLLHDLKSTGMELKVIETENFYIVDDLINLLKQGQYKAAICLHSIKDERVLAAIPSNKRITIGYKQKQGNFIEFGIESFLNSLPSIKEYTLIPDQHDFSIYEMIIDEFAKKEHTISVVNLDDSEIPKSFFSLEHKKFIVFSTDMIEKILSFYEGSDTCQPQFILLSCKTGYQLFDSIKVNKFYFSSNELALKIINMIHTLSKDKTVSNYVKETVNLYMTDQQTLKRMDKKTTIKLLLLKNPFSKALKHLAFKFTKETNISIEITDLSFDDLNKRITENRIDEFDLIKLDVSYFPWLGPDLLLNLSNIPEIVELSSQMKDWKNYCYVTNQLLGLPADPSIQMMLYRKDAFDNPIIQKAYSEEFGRPLLPPSTYKDLSNYCEFYQSMTMPERNTPYPLSIVKGSSILLASEFLPYFYSSGGSITYENDMFELSSEAFLDTLNTYRMIRAHSKIENEKWWDSEIKNFNRYKTSMIICYTNHLNQISAIDYNYCSVPGQMPAFGGGVLGILKNSKKIEENTLFFQWLYQYRIQEQLASLGVCIPRTHLFDERNNYRKYPFLSYSSKNFSLGKRIQYLSDNYILNTIELEKIIGDAINLGIENESSDYDILIKIHNQLNSNKRKLIREI
ncbi:hypothetical protein IGI37_000873 [Enterococcus sp. AZ194]|uniref:extracellular solute-binding protein n=1 Tax=Enterococcus sp. AZ194 TaxID=2774629 RepID=UPI003F294F1B